MFFIHVCTNFYINALHLPYNLDLSLQSKACMASACRGLRPALRTARSPRSEGWGLAWGIWTQGAPDSPRRVSDASSGPHLKECRSLGGDQGWWLESGHKVASSLHLQHHRPHIPGRRECGHHSSVRQAPDSGGQRRQPSVHCPLHVANRSRDSGPLTSREGKAWGWTFLLVNGDRLGISGAGLPPPPGLAHSPDTRPRVWDERCPRCSTSRAKIKSA